MMESKKLCPTCKKGYLEKKPMTQYLNIDGAPEFKVENFPVAVCTSCSYEIVTLSESSELNKLFLEQLIQFYTKKPWDVPGKPANWMRKVVGITARDLATSARIEESTLSHAFKKNTTLDRTAATFLLFRSRDFLNGNSKSDEIIKKFDDPDSFFQPQIPIADIVRQIIATGPIFDEQKPTKKRGQASKSSKKEKVESAFSGELYAKFTVKGPNQKVKRGNV